MRFRWRSRAGQTADSVPYAVVDLETTGFSPSRGDRVVEVAVVRTDPKGRVEAEFTSLVDPERDVGPTHIHGVRPSDLVGAPRFADIAGDVAQHLTGAVLVAHNVRFDLTFLRAEFERAGVQFPHWPALCTLRLAHRHVWLPSFRLSQCCEAFGIELSRAHSALDDARAVARFLFCLMELALQQGAADLAALGCEPTTFPRVAWPPLPPSGRAFPRGTPPAIEQEPSYLERLIERLSPIDTGDADLAAYLDLLDRVLEDRRVSKDEADALLAIAREWGLDRDDAERAHRLYLQALCEAALRDGRISATERADLDLVRRLFCLDERALDEAIAAAQLCRPSDGVPIPRLVGKTVCFTGALSGCLDGEPISRERARDLAAAAGLIVRDRVTKDLDILVVADPHTKSTKARMAARYGVRIMAEAAFWRAIGVQVD